MKIGKLIARACQKSLGTRIRGMGMTHWYMQVKYLKSALINFLYLGF